MELINNSKVKITNLSNDARVAEVAGTATTIINAFAEEIETFAEDTTLIGIMTEVETTNGELITAIEKDKAISEREQYDNKRDEAYRALYNVIKGTTYYPEESARIAAIKVKTVLDKYPKLTRLAYEEQTAQTKSLIEELESDEMKLQASLIPSFTTILTKLKLTQKEYEEAYRDYLTALAKDKTTKSATQAKPEVITAINNRLLVYLRSMAEFNTKTYGEFAGKVAVAIDKANINIRIRRNQQQSTQLN